MFGMPPRVIVLTGVTYGLGYAMALEFAQRGHTVLGCGRSQDRIEALREEFGAPHHFSAVDVSRDEDVALWAQEVISSYGAPELLLNNAALMNDVAPLWQISPEEFSRMMQVNVEGVVNVIRHFVPAMNTQNRGIIVNFSSGWGRGTSPGVAPYCATKWAIEGLSKALAQELPEGVACVPVNPGVIHTRMLDVCFGEAAADYPGPKEWSRVAVPFLLKLNRQHNGKSVTVPF